MAYGALSAQGPPAPGVSCHVVKVMGAPREAKRFFSHGRSGENNSTLDAGQVAPDRRVKTVSVPERSDRGGLPDADFQYCVTGPGQKACQRWDQASVGVQPVRSSIQGSQRLMQTDIGHQGRDVTMGDIGGVADDQVELTTDRPSPITLQEKGASRDPAPLGIRAGHDDSVEGSVDTDPDGIRAIVQYREQQASGSGT